MQFVGQPCLSTTSVVYSVCCVRISYEQVRARPRPHNLALRLICGYFSLRILSSSQYHACNSRATSYIIFKERHFSRLLCFTLAPGVERVDVRARAWSSVQLVGRRQGRTPTGPYLCSCVVPARSDGWRLRGWRHKRGGAICLSWAPSCTAVCVCVCV